LFEIDDGYDFHDGFPWTAFCHRLEPRAADAPGAA
jgi:hypothetical protein